MFKRTIKSLCVCVVFAICFFALVSNGMAATTSIFINEIHYDNVGADSGEAIEIFGPAGSDLSGWTLELYNGYNGENYSTISLTGSIPNQQNGFGTLYYSATSLQNGPDGIALVDNGSPVQFLSYEGQFEAADGPAATWDSIDIGVTEEPAPEIGYSLQLTGSGRYYEDFSWIGPDDATFGALNNGQTAVPIPGAIWLLGSGLVGIVGIRRKFNK